MNDAILIVSCSLIYLVGAGFTGRLLLKHDDGNGGLIAFGALAWPCALPVVLGIWLANKAVKDE